MQNLEELRFTEEHEWVRVEEGYAYVGITEHAQDALGDIVFVELPEVGEMFDKDEAFGVVESTKTTSDLYCPLSGKVVEVNEGLVDSPGLVNDDPYGEGWMIRILIKDADELNKLMNLKRYEQFLLEEDED